MYAIVNKNTFFHNVPNEHENTSRQGKNGKLRKAGVTSGRENGQVVVTAVSRLPYTGSLNSIFLYSCMLQEQQRSEKSSNYQDSKL